MKILALLIALSLPVPAFAQLETAPAATAPAGELPYADLMRMAEEKLVPSGPNKIIYEGAAIVIFNRAQKVAPDDAKKAEALIRMGETEMLLKAYPSAVVSFADARKLQNLSNDQQARALFGYAFARHQAAKSTNKVAGLSPTIFSEYQAALAFTELAAPQRLQAHEAVAEVWTALNRPLDAALEYQKIVALPIVQNGDRKKFYIRHALLGLQQEKASPQALQLINSLNQQLLQLPKTDVEIVQFKNFWADLLVKQNDQPGAIKQWNEIAGSGKFAIDTRAKALRDIHKHYLALKNWNEALKAADRLAALPGVTPPYLALRFKDRAATFSAQQQEAKAREEWMGILSIANVEAEEKAQAWTEIANSLKREISVKPPKPNHAALVVAQKKALESAWGQEGAMRQTRAAALLNRTQLDLDDKDTATASTRVLEALKVVEPWEDTTGEAMAIKREFYFSLSVIYRLEKSYTKAIAALIGTQKLSGLGDSSVAQSAIDVSNESYAAQKWDEARVVLLALKNVWGLPDHSYFLNQAYIEVGAKNWEAAKKVLTDFAASNPSADQKTEAEALRAQIPATP